LSQRGNQEGPVVSQSIPTRITRTTCTTNTLKSKKFHHLASNIISLLNILCIISGVQQFNTNIVGLWTNWNDLFLAIFEENVDQSVDLILTLKDPSNKNIYHGTNVLDDIPHGQPIAIHQRRKVKKLNNSIF